MTIHDPTHVLKPSKVVYTEAVPVLMPVIWNTFTTRSWCRRLFDVLIKCNDVFKSGQVSLHFCYVFVMFLPKYNIGASKGCQGRAPPLGFQILSFSCSFRQKKNSLAHPLLELVSPSGNPESATVQCIHMISSSALEMT